MRPFAVCLLYIIIASATFAQQSSNRIALVIGVQNYVNVPTLRHSLNDANDMAAALKSKGFQVDFLRDPKSKKEIKDAIIRYYNTMRDQSGAVGIIYYAGHGTQYEGENYLIPASANIQIPGDIDEQCVKMNSFMSVLNSTNNNLNIFLIDACRTNSFPSFSRDILKGLIAVEAPKGSIVVFATQPGKLASDGTGKNGLFTSKLLKYINEPDLNITEVFRKVKQEVNAESEGKQLPSVVDNSIGGNFYFTKGESSYSKVVLHPTEVPGDKSIAVLSFVNMSNDPDQEYFSDGISEEVLNLLTKVPELKVIGRSSSFYFKGKNEDLRTIGEKLGVAYLLGGSVRKDGNKVRITVQLIRSADASNLWSETYDRQLENIFDLQDEIAQAVLGQLKLKLLASSSLTRSSENNIEVHNLLLQGNYLIDKGNTEDFVKADKYFHEALALDSGKARIWAALAKAKLFLGAYSSKYYLANSGKAREYAARALLLDKQSAEAHRIMGVFKMFYDFDWSGADQQFRLALELEPGNSDTYRNLGQLELYLGRYEMSVYYLQKAIVLNPLSFPTIDALVTVLLSMSRYEEAIHILKNAVELDPTIANAELAVAYLVSHNPQQTRKQLELLPSGFSKTYYSAIANYELGQKNELNEVLNKSLIDSATVSIRIARIYAIMNQKDKAFEWLEKAYKAKYQMWVLKSDYFLANLRGDPRYENLLRRMNLPLE